MTLMVIPHVERLLMVRIFVRLPSQLMRDCISMFACPDPLQKWRRGFTTHQAILMLMKFISAYLLAFSVTWSELTIWC